MAQDEQRAEICPAISFSEKVIREAGTEKLSIINSFQRFYGREFPFVVPPFFVTVGFAGLSGKVERLKVAVELVNGAGAQIVPPVSMEVSSKAEVTPDEAFEMSFFLPSCRFDAPGVYEVLFRVGDHLVGRRSLPARLMPAPQAAAPPAPPTPKRSRAPKDGKTK